MARDKATIARLKSLEDGGALVINSAYGIDNCVRRPMTELLIKEEFLIRRVLLFPQQTSILKTVILVG